MRRGCLHGTCHGGRNLPLDAAHRSHRRPRLHWPDHPRPTSPAPQRARESARSIRRAGSACQEETWRSMRFTPAGDGDKPVEGRGDLARGAGQQDTGPANFLATTRGAPERRVGRSGQRILPPETAEPGEVSIAGDEGGAMTDQQRRSLNIIDFSWRRKRCK
jgi:hypothetical protein